MGVLAFVSCRVQRFVRTVCMLPKTACAVLPVDDRNETFSLGEAYENSYQLQWFSPSMDHA